MGRVDGKERHKVKMALKYCKAKLTEHCSEERRKVSIYGRYCCPNVSLCEVLYKLQVLRHAPYKLSCYLPTRQLAQQTMWQINVPEDIDEEQYVRHLAIFVSVKLFLLRVMR